MNELLRFEPPRAGQALRGRVLDRATAALASSAAPSRTDRIWYSRRFRLAWAGAIVALALLEAAALRTASGPLRPSPAPPVAGEADAAAVALGLPPGDWIGVRVVTSDGLENVALEESQ